MKYGLARHLWPQNPKLSNGSNLEVRTCVSEDSLYGLLLRFLTLRKPEFCRCAERQGASANRRRLFPAAAGQVSLSGATVAPVSTTS